MRRTVPVFLMMSFLPAVRLAGQEKGTTSDSGSYRVEFNIHDGSDAAARTGRRYVMMVEPNDKVIFRAGQKVPYTTGALHQVATGAPPLTQFNYAETGVNIEYILREIDRKLRLRGTLDVSSVLNYERSAAAMLPMPIIGQVRVDVDALVTPGKPTTIASIDDPVTTRKFEVEVTATKLN